MLPISLLKGSCVRNESALRKDQDLYLLRCPLPSRRRTTLSALAEQLRSALLQSSLYRWSFSTTGCYARGSFRQVLLCKSSTGAHAAKALRIPKRLYSRWQSGGF
jgi:hypothetical protein